MKEKLKSHEKNNSRIEGPKSKFDDIIKDQKYNY